MSLRARLLAAFAYTLLVVIVALEVPLGINLDKRVNSEVEAESAGQAQIVAATASDRLGQPAELSQIATDAAQQLGGTVMILDGQARVLADSSSAAVGSTLQSPEILGALGGAIAQDRGSGSGGDEVLSTGVPIVRNGQTEGAVAVTQNVESVNSSVRDDILALAGIGLLALALGLGVAWILAGSIARPLRSLSDVARRMAGGDLRARADEKGSREQQELAHAFNEMADRLESLLESQRAFVADASHQLRTPLTGLRLRLEAAGVKSGDAAVAKELEAAEHETARLDELVADLLELAASEQPAEDERAEVGDAARAAIERWRAPASEGGHDLSLAMDGDGQVRAAPAELAAILDNLVENAIRYSPRGAPVKIECRTENGVASLGVLSQSGPIEPEVAERAFERFYRGARGPGTGLGLAIVAALARRRGGRARLSNTDGGSVRVEVTLPVADFANS